MTKSLRERVATAVIVIVFIMGPMAIWVKMVHTDVMEKRIVRAELRAERSAWLKTAEGIRHTAAIEKYMDDMERAETEHEAAKDRAFNEWMPELRR